MADRRKLKKRKDEECYSNKKSDKASKDEIKLAKWMKKNIVVKKTKFANHVVEYFTGSKAVDVIMESEWAKPKNPDEDPFFRSRTDAVIFLDGMLRHKMFHRCKKIIVSEEELKAKKLKNKKDKKGEVEDEKRKKDDDDKDAKKKKKKHVDENKELTDKSQAKKKIRLEMHFVQVFSDGLDAYVWIYNPLPFYYWIFGFLVVIGSIGICLFPLWPPSVRMGVQYLSIAGACFIAFIIVLAILRLIIFCLVWIATFGKFHLWLFPNLTEDVGFFASFWPLYQYEFKKVANSKKSKSSKNKNKKEKSSDYEDEEDDDDDDDEDEISDEEHEDEEEEEEKQNDVSTVHEVLKENVSDTESEPSSSQQSESFKDFEVIDRTEFAGASNS